MQVYAAYAACVGMNNILPANLGTIVMFVMLTTVIASATFAGLIGGFLVEKISSRSRARSSTSTSSSSVSRLVRLRLLLAQGAPVGDGDPRRLGRRRDRARSPEFLAEGPRVVGQAKEGGQILAHPGAYFGRVFVPSFVGWVASLCVVAIFLAAYAIPVTFHTVITVVGSNSISNTVAVTPGGAGVNQAFNAAALSDVTDSQTATAYSIAQQLVTTAWTILMALVLMVWVFGWGGGKTLVTESYQEAKRKAEEQKARKAAEEAAKQGGAVSHQADRRPGSPDQTAGCVSPGGASAAARSRARASPIARAMWTAAERSGAATIIPIMPEQRTGGDRHDQDGERVEVERGTERERLEEVLQEAVREDHDHEHDRRRRRALRAEREQHRERAGDERAEVRDVGGHEGDDRDRAGERNAQDQRARSRPRSR